MNLVGKKVSMTLRTVDSFDAATAPVNRCGLNLPPTIRRMNETSPPNGMDGTFSTKLSRPDSVFCPYP